MRTKNWNLLEKLSRKPKVSSLKKYPNKRVLGHSIDKRPKEIDGRKTFGHWKIDIVVGNKIKTDAVILTLVERQTCLEVIIKANGKDQESVDQVIRALQERSGDDFSPFFKTITSDNGSEFVGLQEFLKDTLDVYLSRSYASFERETSDNQHIFIRQFIPKGKPISQFTESRCLRIQQWINEYPRKILDYRNPNEFFVNAHRLNRQAY